jgi:hypothetical protein
MHTNLRAKWSRCKKKTSQLCVSRWWAIFADESGWWWKSFGLLTETESLIALQTWWKVFNFLVPQILWDENKFELYLTLINALALSLLDINFPKRKNWKLFKVGEWHDIQETSSTIQSQISTLSFNKSAFYLLARATALPWRKFT